MTENYLQVLEESLRKKLTILDQLREYSRLQQEVFQSDVPDLEQYDSYVDAKDKLIDEIIMLDNGFEILYANVSQELKDNRDKYRDQIRILQDLVRKVTEESVALQTQEERNKTLVENFFRGQRTAIGQGRKSSRAAYGYYKNMSNAGVETSQFLDSKK